MADSTTQGRYCGKLQMISATSIMRSASRTELPPNLYTTLTCGGARGRGWGRSGRAGKQLHGLHTVIPVPEGRVGSGVEAQDLALCTT